jgi:hypothetical protein
MRQQGNIRRIELDAPLDQLFLNWRHMKDSSLTLTFNHDANKAREWMTNKIQAAIRGNRLAIKFLTTRSAHLEQVCQVSGVDHERVLKKAREWSDKNKWMETENTELQWAREVMQIMKDKERGELPYKEWDTKRPGAPAYEPHRHV